MARSTHQTGAALGGEMVDEQERTVMGNQLSHRGLVRWRTNMATDTSNWLVSKLVASVLHLGKQLDIAKAESAAQPRLGEHIG